MQELTHYINGAHVKGTSGRFADVMNQQSAHVIRCELDFFITPKLEDNISKNQDEHVQTTIPAC